MRYPDWLLAYWATLAAFLLLAVILALSITENTEIMQGVSGYGR